MRARRLRPFRLGLWLGIIGAAIWFVQRYQRSHDIVAPAMPPPEPYRPAPVPSVPIVQPEVVEVGDVDQPGEPEVGTVDVAPPPPPPAPPAPEAPAKKPKPVKKAAKKKAPAEPKQVTAAWVAPDGEGICPTTHPVKAKLSSKLFHLPGMFAYARTKPDRCYRDEDAAVADGLQKAKR